MSASPDAAGSIACTACPLLCGITNVPVGPEEAVAGLSGCGHAARWIPEAVHRHLSAAGTGPMISGRAATLAEAVEAAATRLAEARRVLVTGVGGLSLEGIRAAAAVAERIGAAFDTGAAEASSPLGPTLARVGGVTADWEELRDRADLVVLHAIDPSVTHPRFVERFLVPPVAGRPRRVVTIGPESVRIDGVERLWLQSRAGTGTEAARLLEGAVKGVVSWERLSSGLGGSEELGRSVGAWFDEARCVGVIHRMEVPQSFDVGSQEAEEGDPAAVRCFAIASLVRSLSHRKPAFAIPLGAGATEAAPNAAAAAAVATWRYGAAGGIARAVATGGRFLPGECDGRTLVDRGEVDVVFVAGTAPRWLGRDDGGRPPGQRCGVVHVGPPSGRPDGVSVLVSIPTAWPGFDESGTLLREDGRGALIGSWFASGLPAAAEVLRSLGSVLGVHEDRIARGVIA